MNAYKSKIVIICGATSGIGREMALYFVRQGYRVGAMGRRRDLLESFKNESPDTISIMDVDINHEDATERFIALVKEMGGMDIYIHVSGIGFKNLDYDVAKEMAMVETNSMGFARMVSCAYRYFVDQKSGHLAVVSSVAGTMGLGAAPAYSSTKRFQNHYIQCLQQHSKIRNLNITFSDIRPGFVDTDLLKGSHYPMLMGKEKVARIASQAVMKKKRVKVIDWRWAIVVFFWRLIPNPLWEHLRIK